jgi:prepilin-type N-terminal cleavage/methylation domain-containing protein
MLVHQNPTPDPRPLTSRKGFTLVELLVVIAIIGILVALLLPAVQAAREAGRRTQCKDNLKNIGLACLNHADTLKAYPTGGEFFSPLLEYYVDSDKAVSIPKQGMGWGFQILPYLEEDSVHGLTDQEQLGPTVIPLYICPSRRGVVQVTGADEDTVVRVKTLTDYAGVHPCTKRFDDELFPLDLTTEPDPGTVRNYFVKDSKGGSDRELQPHAVYDGVIVRSPFKVNKYGAPGTVTGEFVEGVPFPTKSSKITDGTSKTMMVSEKYIYFEAYAGGSASDDRGWTDGWDADTMRCTCIRPMHDAEYDPEHTGTASRDWNNISWYTLVIGSAHPSSVNAVYGDGSVHSINYDIDLYVFNALGTRNNTSGGPLFGGNPGPEVVPEGF